MRTYERIQCMYCSSKIDLGHYPKHLKTIHEQEWLADKLSAARQSTAVKMREQCAARILELMCEWGTSGSYLDFGTQLHNAIDALPLDPAPEQEMK